MAVLGQTGVHLLPSCGMRYLITDAQERVEDQPEDSGIFPWYTVPFSRQIQLRELLSVFNSF